MVTGAAGFIGANLVFELLKTVGGVNLVGIDNMNDYYDVSIKEYRLRMIEDEVERHPESSWNFLRGDKGSLGIGNTRDYAHRLKEKLIVSILNNVKSDKKQ